MKKKVLIVDDDVGFAKELEDALLGAGYDVLSISDGMQAVYTATHKIKPTIILLDLKLKHRSGFEVATELRKRRETSGIPIIAMSGFYSEENNNWLKSFCDIDIFLNKPFSPADAIAKIKKALSET